MLTIRESPVATCKYRSNSMFRQKNPVGELFANAKMARYPIVVCYLFGTFVYENSFLPENSNAPRASNSARSDFVRITMWSYSNDSQNDGHNEIQHFFFMFKLVNRNQIPQKTINQLISFFFANRNLSGALLEQWQVRARSMRMRCRLQGKGMRTERQRVRGQRLQWTRLLFGRSMLLLSWISRWVKLKRV